jgi:hypothetical protein
VLRFVIPLALAVIVVVAALHAPQRHDSAKTACAPSERQLAALGCNR